MNAIEQKAAIQARKELQKGIDILIDEQHELERSISINAENDSEQSKVFVAISRKRLEASKVIYEALYEVNEWLFAMEKER